MKKVLINVEERELRVAMLEDEQLVELYIESLDEKSILNNIYKGRVEDVLPGLKAAFVNIGLDRNAFLHFDDVRPDLIWGKYRELNPELADEVPTAREAFAEAATEPDVEGEDETAEGKRKRRRGRRGGKKRRPDAEDTYSPGLPVGVTEDDLEDEDEDEMETHPVAAQSYSAPELVEAVPAQYPQHPDYAAESEEEEQPATYANADDQYEESEEDVEPAMVASGQAGAPAPSYERGVAPSEEEIERRRLARMEKQKQRRERWEQKKLERQQRRQQERAERMERTAGQPSAGPAAAPMAASPAYEPPPPPAAPAVYGTRGAAHSTDSYATFTVGNQRRSARQRFADQQRYGDNFGNIAVKSTQRIDHRESQVDFFGPAAHATEEQHSIWDDRQPNLGPVPGGRIIFDDDFPRPARNDRFGSDRRPPGQGGQQNRPKKFNKDNKRRGGKKRNTMRKRDNKSYFAFSADDIPDSDDAAVNSPAEDSPAPAKKAARKRKAVAAEPAVEAAPKKSVAKPAAKKAPARKKKTDEPETTRAVEQELPLEIESAPEAPAAEAAPAKKPRAAKKPAAPRTRKAAAKFDTPTAEENITAFGDQPAEVPAKAVEATPAPSPESAAPAHEATASSTEAPATEPGATAVASQVTSYAPPEAQAAPEGEPGAPSADQNGEAGAQPQRRIRETRAQRFARIRRERAAAKAEARAAAAENAGATPEAAATAVESHQQAEAQPRTDSDTRPEREPRHERESRHPRDKRGRHDRGDREQRGDREARPDREHREHRDNRAQHPAPVAAEASTAVVSTDTARPQHQQSRDKRRDVRPKMRRPQFQEVFRKGDELMVQVVKEEIGLKGARISSYVSLPGRYLVLLPYPNQEGGISRKVEDIKERKRLKNLLQDISSDETAFIIRTAGVFQDETEIRKDVEFLSHEWGTIADRYKKAGASALVYDDHDIIYRLARDVFDDSVAEILIDSHLEFEKLKGILSKLIPNLVDKVKLYSGAENIFHKFGVTKQIQKAARRKVWLKSGGYLIIDEAEALTAIDVNTGKSVGKDDQEKLILRTNLESARAVARELKLRDIGGLIVIDFIDMKDPRNREQVLHELKLQLRKDRSKTSVSAISEFGLVEMTRKRVRRSLRKTLFMDCPYCQGAGVVLNEQQIWLHIKHEVVRQLESQRPSPSLNITVNPRIRAYIDQNYREVIRRLEQKYDSEIRVSMSDIFHIENYQIDKAESGGVITGSATMPTR